MPYQQPGITLKCIKCVSRVPLLHRARQRIRILVMPVIDLETQRRSLCAYVRFARGSGVLEETAATMGVDEDHDLPKEEERQRIVNKTGAVFPISGKTAGADRRTCESIGTYPIVLLASCFPSLFPSSYTTSHPSFHGSLPAPHPLPFLCAVFTASLSRARVEQSRACNRNSHSAQRGEIM